MTSRLRVLVSLLCCCMALTDCHAQFVSEFLQRPWIGIGVSYRSLAVGAERTNNAELKIDQPAADQFVQPSLMAGVSFQVAPSLYVRPSVRLSFSSVDGASSRPVVLAVNQQAVNATLTTEYTARLLGAGIDVGVRYRLLNGLGLTVAPNVGLAVPVGISMQDRILTPSQTQFTSSGTTTQDVPTARVPTSAAFMFGLGAEVDIRLYRETNTALSALMFARAYSQDVATSVQRIPWELGIGLQLAFNDFEDDRNRDVDLPEDNGVDEPPQSPQTSSLARLTPVYHTVYVYDTINIVDTWAEHRKDTIYLPTESIRIDTIRSTSSDTVILRRRQAIARHLPGPRPYISSILELEVKGLPVDSLITLEVRSTVITDGRSTTIIRVTVDNTLVETTHHTQEQFIHAMRLSDLLKSYTFASSAEIVITAQTTDMYGQTTHAAPVHAKVRRRANHKIDIDIP